MWAQVEVSVGIKQQQLLAEAEEYRRGLGFNTKEDQNGAQAIVEKEKSHLRRLGESLGMFSADGKKTAWA